MGSPTFGLSAQGTILRRSIDPLWPDRDPQGGPLAFVDVAELGDISGPELSRKVIETTTHNQLDDRFIVGIRRHGELSVTLNWIPDDPTHDHLTGLVKSWDDGARDIFETETPIGSKVLFSGFVTNVGLAYPVDDKMAADVTIRPTGKFKFVAPA